MPWENRFHVRTASQTNAYRQLIHKEAMRRRNEAAILSRYRFQDHVTSLDGLASHWDGVVVGATMTGSAENYGEGDGSHTTNGRASQQHQQQQQPPLVQGARALLQRQSKSSVLNEGFPYDTDMLRTVKHVAHDTAASVVSEQFAPMNPDSADPMTRARLRAKNRAIAAAKLQELRDHARENAEHIEQAAMLRQRLSSVAAKGAVDLDRYTHAAVNVAADRAAMAARMHGGHGDQASAAPTVGEDIAPANPVLSRSALASGPSTADPKAASPKRFGLKTCFAGSGSRPMSGVNRDALAERARAVFAPLPEDPVVVAARSRLQSASALANESAARLHRAVSPVRVRSSTAQASFHGGAQLSQLTAPEAAPKPSDGGRPPRPSTTSADTADPGTTLQARSDRIAQLENELEESRAARGALQASLASLCDRFEHQQQQQQQQFQLGPTREESARPEAARRGLAALRPASAVGGLSQSAKVQRQHPAAAAAPAVNKRAASAASGRRW